MLEKEWGCELVEHRCVVWRIIAWERGRLARNESNAASSAEGFAPAELGARASRPQCKPREWFRSCGALRAGRPRSEACAQRYRQAIYQKIAFRL